MYVKVHSCVQMCILMCVCGNHRAKFGYHSLGVLHISFLDGVSY